MPGLSCNHGSKKSKNLAWNTCSLKSEKTQNWRLSQNEELSESISTGAQYVTPDYNLSPYNSPYFYYRSIGSQPP